MTNVFDGETWLCDIQHSIVCNISSGAGSSNNSNQSQSSGVQNLASNQTGQYASGATNAPQLQDALNQGQNLYQNGNPLTNAGLSNINTGAQAGQSLNTTGNAALNSTLDGSMLSAGNPYFQQMVTQLGQSIQPQIDGQFAAAGRYGSGANANAYADALSRQAGQLAYQNYGQERTNQLGAVSQLPGYTAGLSNPGQQQLTAGYAPLNQYIQQLGALKPGTLGSGSSVSNQSGTSSTSGSGIGQGDTSNFGVNATAKNK